MLREALAEAVIGQNDFDGVIHDDAYDEDRREESSGVFETKRLAGKSPSPPGLREGDLLRDGPLHQGNVEEGPVGIGELEHEDFRDEVVLVLRIRPVVLRAVEVLGEGHEVLVRHRHHRREDEVRQNQRQVVVLWKEGERERILEGVPADVGVGIKDPGVDRRHVEHAEADLKVAREDSSRFFRRGEILDGHAVDGRVDRRPFETRPFPLQLFEAVHAPLHLGRRLLRLPVLQKERRPQAHEDGHRQRAPERPRLLDLRHPEDEEPEGPGPQQPPGVVPEEHEVEADFFSVVVFDGFEGLIPGHREGGEPLVLQGVQLEVVVEGEDREDGALGDEVA
mmetsp:Transcript_37733/g.121088  ORF Transcript_37733/g.121088 Transcript_37733/m.121088 type:complete len:337 (-) Transcript_37733:744-1754(-)